MGKQRPKRNSFKPQHANVSPVVLNEITELLIHEFTSPSSFGIPRIGHSTFRITPQIVSFNFY